MLYTVLCFAAPQPSLAPFVFRLCSEREIFVEFPFSLFCLFFPQIVPLISTPPRPSCRHFQASSLGLKLRKQKSHFLFAKKNKTANIPIVHLHLHILQKGNWLVLNSWNHQFQSS